MRVNTNSPYGEINRLEFLLGSSDEEGLWEDEDLDDLEEDNEDDGGLPDGDVMPDDNNWVIFSA